MHRNNASAFYIAAVLFPRAEEKHMGKDVGNLASELDNWKPNLPAESKLQMAIYEMSERDLVTFFAARPIQRERFRAVIEKLDMLDDEEDHYQAAKAD